MNAIQCGKCRRHFLLIKKPARMGEGVRGEGGNAAFASEPFPPSPRQDLEGDVDFFKEVYDL